MASHPCRPYGCNARGWQRLVAVLTFDSAIAPAVALGVRGAVARSRQLLFTVDGYDIDLRIDRAADGSSFAVRGQVFGLRVHAVARARSATHDVEGQIDPLGEFRLPTLNAGTWRLAIEGGIECIELPELVLGAA